MGVNGTPISQLTGITSVVSTVEFEINNSGQSQKISLDQISDYVISNISVGAVTSVFGRTGAVVAINGDYTTNLVPEAGGVLYYTNARAINSTLTGYTSLTGTITSADTILSAIEKLNGNMLSLNTGVNSVIGTANRITSSGGANPVIDIAATYIGQSSITTLGTITSGVWAATKIATNHGGTGTDITFTPGSVVFAGAFGVYTEDNANFNYDLTHHSLLLGASSYGNGRLSIEPSIGNHGIVINNIPDAQVGILSTYSNNSTAYPTSGTGNSHLALRNASTTVGSSSTIRFINNTTSAATLGSLYTDGSSADFFLAVAKNTFDVTHSLMYIKGSLAAVGFGTDFKTPTSILNVDGATTNQSSFAIKNATALPTGTNRKAGDMNYFISGGNGRFYGYKNDNTTEEGIAWLSDIAAGSGITGTGTVGYLSKWGTTTSLNDSIIFQTSSKIGIGTTLPFGRLHIKTVNSTGIYVEMPLGSGDSAFKVYSLDGEGFRAVTDSGTGITIISNTGTGFIYNGNGSGVLVSSTNVAGSFTSKSVAGIFRQYADLALTVTNTDPGVSIERNYSLGAADATGAMLRFTDTSASTGNTIETLRNGSTRFIVNNIGYIGINVTTAPYALTINGTADADIGMIRNTTAATSGRALFVRASGATLGTTDLNGGTISLIPGTNTGLGTSGIDFYGGAGTASGTTDTAASIKSRMDGRGFWTIGNTVGPVARMDIYSDNGTYIMRWNNKTLGGNIGYSYEIETNGSNTNMIINEHTSTPSTLQRQKWFAGGRVLIGAGSVADALLHINGTFKLVDGSQGNLKVLTSDGTGLATWGNPGLSNVMTTIGDIIQANTGGTPQRLGNSTTGTYLRSVSGALNVWSTLVLPNAVNTGEIFLGTTTNTMGSSSELTYSSSSAQFQVSKSVNYLSNVLNNTSTGTGAMSSFRVNNSLTSMELGLTSNGFTSTIAGVSIGSNKTYLTAASGGFFLFGTSTTYFYAGTSLIMAYNVNGVGIGNGAGAAARLDLGAGTTSLGPLHFNVGSLISTLIDGSMEYDGTNFFLTRSFGAEVRERILAGTLVSGTFTPSTTQAIRVNIGGTLFNVMIQP